LSKESHLAEKVKKDVPILIILGNPPYAGHSTNNSEWISKEIEEYYKVNGQALKEKNTKWLQDDYVKFIRFAQWKIDKVGSGIIGFVTNHSFIDSPTFRGMRQSLKDSFEYIYVIDLHGNSRKNERCPDGSKDENVFDIQQGVSILFLIKTCNCKNHYSVKHADLWGVREEKYNWLSSNSVNTTDWSEVEPIKPYYYFSPFNNAKLGEYLKFARIKDIFPINSVGIVTARDKFTVEYDSEKLYRKLKDFVSLDTETARLLYDLGNDTSDWKVHLAQKDLIDSGLKRENILNIMYRPFDIRYTYYTGNSKRFHCRPRPKVMKNMIRKNIALLTTRQVNNDFHHVFCSDKLTDFCALSTKTKENTYVFPLYIYTDEQNKMFNEEKKPNINRNFQNSLIQTFCHEVTPQEIFYYSYAMLFSNSYRNKYDEFLRRDFPRIPFTSDYKLFCKLVNIGRELVNIHLLKTTECSTPNAKFQGLGNQRVDKINYSVEEKKVFINSKQYFEGLSRSVWEYEIGSYQVCEKWLKSRKGRILRNEEIKSYCQMVKVINTTIELQRKIDSIYSLAKQSFLDFS
jgi:predicted helicase